MSTIAKNCKHFRKTLQDIHVPKKKLINPSEIKKIITTAIFIAFNVLYCLKDYRFVFLYVSTFAWPLKLKIILKLLVVYEDTYETCKTSKKEMKYDN